ncbi:MAG: PEP/pyruvate-binding domain-containing protein [Planctomycetota bacterium]
MSDPTRDALVFTFGLGESACDPARVEILGGKGASLAAMSRAGFPVPPGFTISATCCEWVERHEGRWPDGLEEQVRAALAWLEQTTDRTFGRGPRPLFVAVRSGAAVSMPGMMDTILNCGSDPTIEPWEALRQAINLVFASWHSDRARSYRQHHDVRHIVGTAVNVQAMFPSDRSGVLFTANPNDPASGEMILEASWGLGEAVVSGAVTPDIYILDAASLATKRVVPGSRPGTDPALNAEQVREIAELGRRVEAHFQVPSDIEWGIADGRVALLQTRKIRGLEIIEDVERGRLAEVQRLRGLAGSDHVVWVVHNLSETLPAPTPLTWDIARWFMSAAGGYGQMYRLLGHRPQERESGAGFLELIAGRVYVDPRRAAEFHFGRLPFEYDVEEVLRDRTALDRPPTRFNLDRADSLFFFQLPGMLFGMIRSARQMRTVGQTARERFERVAVPKLEAFLVATQRITLCDLSTTDLLSELQRRRDFVLGEFAGESLVPGFFGGLAHERLRHLLTQLLGSDEGEQLAGQLTTGLEGDVTVEQNVALFEVAAGRQSREAFLQRFGHRAVNEMELSQPRWREDFNYVDRMIGRLRTGAAMSVVADAASVGSDAGSIRHDQSSPHERHLVQIESRRRAEAALPTILAQAGGASLRERVEYEMRQAQALLPYREVGKFHLMRGYETVREALVELGRRWELGRDVFFLRYDELARFERERSSAEERIAQRKLRWRSAQKLSLTDVIDSRRLEEFGRPRPVATGDHAQWECRPIASGVARGTARVVFDPREVLDLGPDAILVCPSTDPGWTPLFVNARGLIVERGGVLSHGAIVAREFGIPAVVLEAATERIADGSQIELDANHGVVTLRTSSTPVTSVPPALRDATSLPEAR